MHRVIHCLFDLQGLLEELNKRLEVPLPMNRFRPNIVVTGCRAAEEDEWQKYTIGRDVVVEAVKPCDRCTVSMAGGWCISANSVSW